MVREWGHILGAFVEVKRDFSIIVCSLQVGLDSVLRRSYLAHFSRVRHSALLLLVPAIAWHFSANHSDDAAPGRRAENARSGDWEANLMS